MEKNPKQRGDLQLNPETLLGALDMTPESDRELYPFVALFGSTHSASTFRDEAIAALGRVGIATFNPQLPQDVSYDVGKHATVEALAMEKALVSVIRIESRDLTAQKEVLNANIGTLGEASMAMVNALLRGQRVVVSVQDDILSTIKDPGILAQYSAFFIGVQDFMGSHPDTLRMCMDGSIGTLIEETKYSFQAQKEFPIKPVNDFTSLKDRLAVIREGRRPWVALGGTSAVIATATAMFEEQKREMLDHFPASHFQRTIFGDGDLKHAWNTVFQAFDDRKISYEEASDKLRELFVMEKGPKENADLLLWLISKYSPSPSSVEEIGFRLAHALSSKQTMLIRMEHFDADGYLAAMKDLGEVNDQLLKKINDITRFRGLMMEHVKRLVRYCDQVLGKQWFLFEADDGTSNFSWEDLDGSIDISINESGE